MPDTRHFRDVSDVRWVILVFNLLCCKLSGCLSYVVAHMGLNGGLESARQENIETCAILMFGTMFITGNRRLEIDVTQCRQIIHQNNRIRS